MQSTPHRNSIPRLADQSFTAVHNVVTQPPSLQFLAYEALNDPNTARQSRVVYQTNDSIVTRQEDGTYLVAYRERDPEDPPGAPRYSRSNYWDERTQRDQAYEDLSELAETAAGSDSAFMNQRRAEQYKGVFRLYKKGYRKGRGIVKK